MIKIAKYRKAKNIVIYDLEVINHKVTINVKVDKDYINRQCIRW